MATMRDVAQLAGVSKATVSHVLNNTRPVLPATRQAVLDAIEELNYRPSAIARSLSTSVTSTIGVLVADITNPFFGELVRGIERQLSNQNYNLVVCNTDEEPEREARYLNLLLDRRVDGLIVAPAGVPQPLFQEFVDFQIPLVFVDRRPAEPYGPVIAADNFTAGYNATKHLIQLGHRRIGIMARNPSLSTVKERVGGYRQALLDFDLPTDENLIEIASSALEKTFPAALHLLTLPKPPTAVVATNHIMALGLLQAVRKQKLTCPDDISLICFDDHPWAPLFTPPLTAVKMPIAEMCEVAVNTLLNAIDNKRQHKNNGEAANQTDSFDVLLDTELIIRASCAPWPNSEITGDRESNS